MLESGEIHGIPRELILYLKISREYRVLLGNLVNMLRIRETKTFLKWLKYEGFKECWILLGGFDGYFKGYNVSRKLASLPYC